MNQIMEKIDGGICAPKGFLANGVFCGIRKNKTKLDLGVIKSTVPCHAAAVYTKNIVKGAPIVVTQKHLADGTAQAVICNSGVANTCSVDGIDTATTMCVAIAKHLNLKPTDIIVASTGVIGVSLPVKKIISGMGEVASGLDTAGNQRFSKAIMTTDTFLKETAVRFEIDGVECFIGGTAKGSGMVNPNMATVLSFLTTDVAISKKLLEQALKEVTEDTFNMLSVDGDTSTNDTMTLMANGLAENPEISYLGRNYATFKEALLEVTTALTKMLAKDGEGATKCLTCNVVGVKTKKEARKLAKSVISSSLVKAAMFAADANWGRVLCALGYADVDFIVEVVDISFVSKAGSITVCENGSGILFDEEVAKQVLSETEIDINVHLYQGASQATAWGCDLTYEYVKINGEYRT